MAQAIAAADATITVLDDRIDIEDRAVFCWLKGHQVHTGRFHNLVIGSQPLPPAWRAATLKIASVPQANHLQPIGKDLAAQRALTAALNEIDPKSTTTNGADVVAKVAAALAGGQIWAIEARHAPHSRFTTRTSLSAWDGAWAPGVPRFAQLRGRWQVGPVVDPSRQPLPADLAAQLARARLPSPGEVVRSEAGKLCAGSIPCDDVSWHKTTFSNSEYGEGVKKAFGLSAETPVYRGDIGNPSISYTLFGRPDHMMMALVSVCQDGDRARGCRPAFEVWRPIGSDARRRSGPHRR